MSSEALDLPDLTGPMPATFAISLFPAPASTSVKPTHRIVTLDQLVDLLKTHDRRPTKDGRGWSGATYQPNTTRNNKNAVEWSVAVGDLDHLTGDEVMEVRERITSLGLAFILYSTFRSTPSDYRIRVVIPLTEPIPAAKYGMVWRQINVVVFDSRNDPQTKDAGRMSYRPAARKGVVTLSEYQPGLALDWTRLPEVSIPLAHAAGARGTTSTGQTLGISRPTLEFLALGAPVGEQRGRALQATRSLLASGLSVQDTAERIWHGLQVSEVGDPSKPWTYDDALALAEDLANREPPPLRKLWVVKGDDPPSEDSHSNWTSSGTLAESEPASVPPTTTKRLSDEPLPLTEMGNAERFVRMFGRRVRYCHPWKTWMVHDGKRWVRDQTATVRTWAKAAHRAIYIEAAETQDDAQRKAIAAWAKKSESADSIAATLKLASAEPGIPIFPVDMDVDPFLLNLENGTLDLHTGQLRKHNPLDYVTKLAPVSFNPDAECPAFLAFLKQVLPDLEVRAFCQRMLGYGLTGDTREQCLAFLYGAGANGKSTLLTAVHDMLGDYARQAAPELLVSRGGDRHPTELADLHGARFVSSVEVDDGRRLAETLVKMMTGGDRMKARYMRADFFEWQPTHKLFLAANHQPVIRGTDEGIWRRIHLVPFSVTIPDAERDKTLSAKLRAELPGILNWAVAGCLDWQANGLGVPKAIREATEQYRAEQDVLRDFLADMCITEDRASAPAGVLFKAYMGWCDANGTKPINSTAFGRRLREGKFTSDQRWIDRKKTRVWLGLRLTTPMDEPGRTAITPRTALDREIRDDTPENACEDLIPEYVVQRGPAVEGGPPFDDFARGLVDEEV